MQSNDGYFSDQLILEQGAIIFFNEGELDNEQFYYLYIAVKGTKVKEYFALLNAPKPTSIGELERVGSILAFGEGSPSSELKQRLHKQYGVYHP